MAEYWSISGFEQLYLEDSWILDLEARPGQMRLSVDLVLREGHSLYLPPAVGEQYCYRRGDILFENVRELAWVGQGRAPAFDASGDADFGSFDSFSAEEGTYQFAGDFGEIRVLCETPPRVELHPKG